MAKGKDDKDAVVKLAKAISKSTKLPLPQVANVMQKHPLDKAGFQKAIADCEKLAAAQVRQIMGKINPF